ncbi:MAG: energy-coupling factor ABC transporter permease [Methanobacteriaceae archaeon]|nr:energy-coupling factor ABC transporter permease [Methanobacteriaceae archaeon]
MHIMEGFLPPIWCLIWYIIAIPVVIYGIKQIKSLVDEYDEAKPLLALSGAFVFVLSSLKFPSVTGSCSHPCGNGLSTIFFGPAVTSVLCLIVLVFQAIILAHGGITTLGANLCSMGIIGPVAAWFIWKGLRKVKINFSIAVFITAFMADIVTYIVTSFQLALAFPQPTFISSLITFLGIFAVTQLPLAIAEGILTVVIINYVLKIKPDLLEKLHIINKDEVPTGDN